MNYIEQVVKEYVERFEQASVGNPVYSKYLEAMGRVDLYTVTVKEVTEVIQPFLYKWGGMGRKLGQKEFQDWKSNLAKQIQLNHKKLGDFKTEDLANTDINKYEPDIKNCYSLFKKAVGRIAAAKVLHLICPNFFPLWDNDIAKGTGIVEFSAGDYYRFMQEMQSFIRKYKKVLSDLATQYKWSVLKIVDECLWWATKRPLCLFFETK